MKILRKKIKSEVFQSSERVSHTGQRNRGVCVCVGVNLRISS